MSIVQFSEKIQQSLSKKKKWKIRGEAAFFNRLSVLMQEGYTFSDSILILLPHHVEAVEDVQRLVDEQFRQGKGVTGVLEALNLSRSYLVSITIAENDGHMIEALKGVAKQIAFAEMMKKKLHKLLLYPATLIGFLLILFFAFRTIFFPNIEQMVSSRGGGDGESSLALSNFLLHVPDMILGSSLLLIGLGVIFRVYTQRMPTPHRFSLYMKIPFLKTYVKLSITKQFAKYLGSLLQSGFSLQASLQILQEQDLQPFVQLFAQRVKARVVYGDTLANAIVIMDVWQKDFKTFIDHGEKSGYLGKELTLYSELLDEKSEQLLQRLLSFVQPTFFVVIALCIVAAYLSLLLPIYNMIDLV
ncbi:MAG: competence type IV pilus assembly protein ComGB [Lysinibacillus sp.]